MNFSAIKPRDPANWIVGFSVLIVGVNGVVFRGHELDDGLIYARYIQNLISGNGLVYNAGEYVNGLTSPLFAWLSLAPAYFFGDARHGSMLISVLSAMGTVIVFYRILTMFIAERRIAALATLFAAGSGITYINLGMETSLFTFMVGLCFFLYFKDDFFPLGICVGLAILTRPEAVFLVPAMALNTWVHKRQWPDLRCYIVPTALVSAQFAFNSLYYGALLPSSGVAKISQGAMGHWGYNSILLSLGEHLLNGFGLPRQMQVFGTFVVPIFLMTLAALSIPLVQARQYLIVSITFLGLYTGFLTGLNIPSQWWYYAIHFTFFSSYVALGICWLYLRVKTGRRKIFRISFIGFFALMLIWQGAINLVLHGKTVREDYREFGLWIAENTPVDSSVALAEIGTVGWYSERRIIDILGLVTSGNADFVAEGDYNSWLELHPPDYILARDPPRFFERAVTFLRTNRPDDLVEVSEFEFPGYKLYRFLPNDVEGAIDGC